MQNELELQQVIFNLLKMQIEFGVYRRGDSLPTIKESSGFFMASVDTIRLAYVRLKQEGYITLRTGTGASVRKDFSEDEIQRHIQAYFSSRRDAVMDIARSAQSLFGYAQWLAFKSAPKEMLDDLESSNRRKEIPALYRMSRQFLLLYGALGNEFLMRLVWQMFLFFQGPYLSLPHSREYFEFGADSYDDILMELIRLCREKNWNGLWTLLENYNDQRYLALCRFYDSNIFSEPGVEQVDFRWAPYKKVSQLCYTLCMELMGKIKLGDYPAGVFLPSLERLARERQVSVNTVRHTLLLLNKLGAVQTINGVGTKVLPLFDCTTNCDFHDDALQKRLWDFAQGFHILALSCRACSKITLDSMDADSIRHWIKKLEMHKCTGVYEDVIYTCYELVSLSAPYQTMRMIYKELAQQLFWGAPLRGMNGDREGRKAHFLPYLDALIDSLNRMDTDGYSKKLEELQIIENNTATEFLVAIGMQEAASLLL